MAFIPRIADRVYLRPRHDTNGKLTQHACHKCFWQFPGTAPGTWYQSAKAPHKWHWVCKDCCGKRNQETAP